MLRNTLESRAWKPIKWSERHSFLDWLLCLTFSRFDIIKGGELYMRRWFVGPEIAGRRIQIHLILAPDTDGALHDHPWDAWFLIFWGGYTEVLAQNLRPKDMKAGNRLLSVYGQRLFVSKDLPVIKDETVAGSPQRSPFPHLVPGDCVQIRRRPGLRFHPARQPHAITRHLKECTWSLSFLGPRTRAWGFWDEEKGWMTWQEHTVQNQSQSEPKTKNQ